LNVCAICHGTAVLAIRDSISRRLCFLLVALSATFLVFFATVPVLASTAAASTGTVGFSWAMSIRARARAQPCPAYFRRSPADDDACAAWARHSCYQKKRQLALSQDHPFCTEATNSVTSAMLLDAADDAVSTPCRGVNADTAVAPSAAPIAADHSTTRITTYPFR
jgi:hypothetical protein